MKLSETEAIYQRRGRSSIRSRQHIIPHKANHIHQSGRGRGKTASPAGHEDKWRLAAVAICISLLSERYGPARSLKASRERGGAETRGGSPAPSAGLAQLRGLICSAPFLIAVAANSSCWRLCSPPVWANRPDRHVLPTSELSKCMKTQVPPPPYSVRRKCFRQSSRCSGHV